MSTIDEIRAAYRDHINAGFLSVLSFMDMGEAEVSAEGCYVTDSRGRRFLDFLGGYGVCNFGHRHRKIVERVHRQLDLMPLSCRLLLSEPTAELAAKLAAITPAGLEHTFFCNSGTEAVEAALKLARASTTRPNIVYTRNAFHGKTFGSLSVTGREKYRAPFAPLLAGFVEVPYGDAAAVEAALDEHTAAVIIEPIQGEGGIVVPPDGYLKDVRRITSKKDVLLILDEIQTGMGRTGRNFACEAEGVSPDMMTLAKALGGGVMPIGAVIGTAKVFAPLEENPLLHTSTFGGNPLACAAGCAAVDVLLNDKLADNAAKMGARLLPALKDLAARYPRLIREVRGRGLMIGLDFNDQDASEVFIASIIRHEMLVAFALNNPGVIRLEPPLVVTEAEVDSALTKVARALAETDAVVAALEG
jgi:putrescine aminotransferase